MGVKSDNRELLQGVKEVISYSSLEVFSNSLIPQKNVFKFFVIKHAQEY